MRSVRACAARCGGSLRFLAARRGGAASSRRARRARCARSSSSRERLRVCRDAVAIELGQRGDRSRRLAEPAQVGRRQQQPQIPGLAELVDLDEPLRAARGCSDARRPPASPSAALRLVELGLDFARRPRRRASALPALICRSISSLRRSPSSVRSSEARRSGFALQRLQPLGRRAAPAPRSAHARAAVRPRPRSNRRDRKDRRDNAENKTLRSPRAQPPVPAVPSPLEDRLSIYI